ncbi:hypothetical protein Busp01_22980 [Trinickia caryophylli]|uniref:4'-phosphopantetheinyl transferase n=1 Tax=Trinickia caryophylli TaxID=28094 RepID=A0A1X7DWC1_TRICW|nr:hypothetical protein Busp01_22980 [Trinickia caryophylli]SMF23041.1 4'-phosphopantetheinyl transferase [Trinickia caryophylli]
MLDVPAAAEAGVEVLLVSIELDAALDSPQLVSLDDDERRRAARFLRREDAVRQSATRAALREALGERLRVPPGSLVFSREESGRPHLAGGADGADGADAAIDFNVSHSGGYALIALSATRRVGVDIESCRQALDWRQLGASVFAPEEAARVAGVDDEQGRRTFFDVWTAKEALVKAHGAGIAIAEGLSGFAVLGERHGEGLAPVVRVVAGVRRAPSEPSIAGFDARWFRAPAGYAACVAWSRALTRPAR